MTAFEDAKAVALRHYPQANCCHEYDKGYHFFDKNLDSDGDCGIVVLKSGGDIISFVPFLLHHSPNPKYVEHSI